MRSDRELQAYITARNIVNKHANEVHEILYTFFRYYYDTGRAVCKNDNSLLKKVKDNLPSFPQSNVHVWFNHNYYFLQWVAKASCNVEGESSCIYCEETINIGELHNGVLKNIKLCNDRKTDYDFDTIKALRQKIIDAYEAAVKIKDEISNELPYGFMEDVTRKFRY